MLAEGLGATFTTSQASAVGLAPRVLYRLRDEGRVMALSRGVWRDVEAPLPTWPDLLAVSVRAPRAVVCGLSAAVVHDLTDALPGAVHVAVGVGEHVPVVRFPPTRVSRLSETALALGVSSVEAAPGEAVRVYDAPRTVVDLLRWRRRVGQDVAYAALRRYVEAPGARPVLVQEYARALGVPSLVGRALDVAVPW